MNGRETKAKARKKFYKNKREKVKDYRDDESEDRKELKQKIMDDFEKRLNKKLGQMNSGEGLIYEPNISIITRDYKFREEITRNDKEVREWREKVFERDDYTCQDCDQKGGELQAHHIKSWSEHPDQRLNLENGLTLCRECHSKRHEAENPELIKNSRYYDRQ